MDGLTSQYGVEVPSDFKSDDGNADQIKRWDQVSQSRRAAIKFTVFNIINHNYGLSFCRNVASIMAVGEGLPGNCGATTIAV